jgi:UDP-3-O-[3-hydroxymyristoyl] N-acetylglucosamine deacetylase
MFIKKISRARTFGFLKEVENLRKNGLAKGGSLDNAVVLGEYKILNGELRFREELVYHKVMDLIGDLFLLGMPVLGHVIAYKAGHALHTEFAQELILSSSKHVVLSGLDFLRLRNQPHGYREKTYPVFPAKLQKIAL